MNRRILSTLIVALVATPLFAQSEPVRVVRERTDKTDPIFQEENYLLSREIAGPTLALAKSVLIADEMGATDNKHFENLTDQLQIRKVVELDRAAHGEARLYFYGSAAQATVNGASISPPEKLPSTGWSWVRVPAELLKAGKNDIVLSGRGRVGYEPVRRPGNSYRSTDGGRTWSNEALGRDAKETGEYMVRLRLGDHAPRGQVLTPVFDLWTTKAGAIARPARLVSVAALTAEQLQPRPLKGTRIAAWLRTGSTPEVEAKSWSEWVSLGKDHAQPEAAAGHRWAQLRFDLTSDDPAHTPHLQLQKFAYELRPEPVADTRIEVAERKEPTIRVSSVPFTYQAPTPRLQLLRERYQLDKVIEPGRTEMEKLILLRHWVRNQWHTAWSGGPAAWMPPWDAHIILEAKDNSDCMTMCTHYAAVYTQCCVALGWNARHCIVDHHCASEVYVDELGKWVMMDPGNSKPRPDANLHYERNGVPLSALEILQAYHAGKTDDLRVCFTPKELMAKIAPLCRPAPPSKHTTPRPETISVAEMPEWPICGIANFRRYGFPDRNDYLTSLLPGELYQGFSPYGYDGYWWVGDDRNEPTVSPEYSRLLSPSRPQDIDWTLNWTRIHLARTAKPGELRVDLETFTPNLAQLERLDDKGEWKRTQPGFLWKLQPGKNVLRVRGMNRFERAGRESSVTVHYGS